MTTAPFQLTRRNVLNNIATLFSGSAAAQGMMVITMLLMARQLGTDRYGQYASCLTLCVLTSTLFNLGMDNWLLPEGSRRASQLGELVGSTLVIKLAAGVCWLALVVMIPPLIRPLTYPRDLLLATGLAVLSRCDSISPRISARSESEGRRAEGAVSASIAFRLRSGSQT